MKNTYLPQLLFTFLLGLLLLIGLQGKANPIAFSAGKTYVVLTPLSPAVADWQLKIQSKPAEAVIEANWEAEAGILHFTLMGLDGKNVRHWEGQPEGKADLAIGEIQNGIYLLQVQQEGDRRKQQFQIQIAS